MSKDKHLLHEHEIDARITTSQLEDLHTRKTNFELLGFKTDK